MGILNIFKVKNKNTVESAKMSNTVSIIKTYVEKSVKNHPDISPFPPTTLSVGEILLLFSLDEKSSKPRDKQSTLCLDYKLNEEKLRTKLLNQKYLGYKDFVYSLSNYNIVDFKGYLKEQGLKVSGKKQELIDRLLTNFSEDILKKHFTNSHFSLTEKAKLLHGTYEFLFYFYSNSFDILPECALNFKNNNTKYNKYEIALLLLSQQLLNNQTNKDWGLYRNTIYNISEVFSHKNQYDIHDEMSFCELNEEFELQLKFLFETCYRDLSGMSNDNEIDDKDIIMLSLDIIYNIRQLKNRLKLTQNYLEDTYYEAIKDVKLSHSYYPKEAAWKKIKKEINKKE